MATAPSEVVFSLRNLTFPTLVTYDMELKQKIEEQLWPLKFVASGTDIPYYTLCYRIRNKTLDAIKIGNTYYIRGSVYEALYMEQAAKVRQAFMAEAA